MGSTPKFFLVHSETGQRYPLAEDVTIGRSHGEIVFPSDGALSSQHCRISPGRDSAMVLDLNSHNGTLMDGMRLHPGQPVIFQPGSRLQIGSQVFVLQKPKNRAVSIKPTRKRRRGPKTDVQMLFAAFVFIIGCGIFLRFYLSPTPEPERAPAQIISPFEMLEKEIEQVHVAYAETGLAHSQNRLPEREFGHQLRIKIAPMFKAARGKLNVVRPGSEWERRKIELTKQHVDAVLLQIDAMVSLSERKTPQATKQLEESNALAKKLAAELERLERSRLPAYFEY